VAAAATASAAPSSATPGTASAPTAAPEPIHGAQCAIVSSGGTPSGSPPPAVLRYRGAATPSREPAPLSGVASRAAVLDRPLPAAAAPASSGPAATFVPSAAPRSAAAGLLAAAAPLDRDHLAGDGPLDSYHPAAARITVDLSLAQLQKLVRLLGLEPAATPRALVHQLMTSL